MPEEHIGQASTATHRDAREEPGLGQRAASKASSVDLGLLQPLLDKYPRRADQLLPVLRAVQDLYGYLPREALDAVAEYLKVSRANVLGVATFYSHFSLVPQGRHKICVCRGTACHVRGSKQVLDAVRRELGIEPGQTTPDLAFTLQTVMCLGACALGPVMTVDGVYYGKMEPRRVASVLQYYRQEL